MKPTRTLALILLITFAGACLLSANAQQPSNEKAESYALAEVEVQQWAQLAQIEKNAVEAYQVAINRAVNTPVGDQSRDVHAAVQSGWLALSLVRTQKEAFTAKLQAERACKGCQIVDGKLTKPKGDL